MGKKTRKSSKKAKSALWQVKEAKRIDATSKTLAELALNPNTSDADFYRAAIFEAVNLDKHRRARESRALAAGVRREGKNSAVSVKTSSDKQSKRKLRKKKSGLRSKRVPLKGKVGGGVEVLNKDTIDPQTAKRLGYFQMSNILAQCKRHKELVDSASSCVNSHLHPTWRKLLAKSSGKARDEFPEFDFPLSLKNFASRQRVESWSHYARKLRNLIQTAKASVDMSEPRSRKKIMHAKNFSTIGDKSTGSIRPGEYGMSHNEREHWRGHIAQLEELIATAPVRVDARIDYHTEHHWDIRRKKSMDPFPEAPFPLTLKRSATKDTIKGWVGFKKKLAGLIATSTSKVDNSWGERGPPRAVRGGGTKKIRPHSVSSRHGVAGSSLSSGKLERPRSTIGAGMRSEASLESLRTNFGDNLPVSHIADLHNTEGLAISVEEYLRGI